MPHSRNGRLHNSYSLISTMTEIVIFESGHSDAQGWARMSKITNDGLTRGLAQNVL